jgi:putative phage-type endonuclease
MPTATAQSFNAEERRQYLGASEIAAVMGIDRWRTPLDVFPEKTGLTEPFTGNKHTERGNRLESIAAELFTELTGQKLQRRTQAYPHPQHPFIVGHIDRVYVGEKKLAEIKCPSIAAFRKYQREGLPESMVIQMQMYLGLTGYKSGTWLIFCADAWDLATFDIDFDSGLYAIAVADAVKFWNENVLAGLAPQEDAAATETGIEKSGEVTFRDDEAFVRRALSLREAVELKRDAEELFENAKKDILEAIEEECGIYECPGLRLHYTDQPGRKSFDKKALAKAHPEIDLSTFEKQGSPFKTFRPYLLKGE